MDIESIQLFLIRCTVVNFAILFVWFAFFVFARDWMRSIHEKFFSLSNETFDVIHYCGMASFKILIFVFNLGPLVAISLAR